MTIIRIIKYLHFQVMTKISIYIIIYTYIYIYTSIDLRNICHKPLAQSWRSLRYVLFISLLCSWDRTIQRNLGNSQRHSTLGYIILVAIIGTTILVPYHYIKSLQLICRSGRRKCHFQGPNIQMRSIDLATWELTRVVAPAMGLLPDT